MIVSAFKQARLSTTPSRHFRDYLSAHLRTTQLHPSAPACSLFLSLAISNSCPTDCSLPPSALLFLGAQNPARAQQTACFLHGENPLTSFTHSLPFPLIFLEGLFPLSRRWTDRRRGSTFRKTDRAKPQPPSPPSSLTWLNAPPPRMLARSPPPTITPYFNPSVVRPSHE